MQIHRAAELQKLPGIAHGFFGRDGGVSTGVYASLNCGPGSRDDSASVADNDTAATPPPLRRRATARRHRLARDGRANPKRSVRFPIELPGIQLR